MNPPVLSIVGPTASGKTPLSLLLAERLRGEIVSADSRQVYRYLTIGTAKPSIEQLGKVQHHFVDMLDPNEEYSAGQYGKDARKVIGEILHRHKTPILVGGSGLYVRAVVDGLFEGPGKDPELREILESRMQTEGPERMLEELRKVDPTAAGRMDPTQRRRILRALEVYHITGKPLSTLHAMQATESPYRFIQFGLNWPREVLYERIHRRVDEMVESGLTREVEGLRRSGYSRRINALNTVGYKEVFEFLDGLRGWEETVELIKRNTRRFAKRQLTWFRADKRIRWIDLGPSIDVESIARNVEQGWRKAAVFS
jgi:tRNA dimethylallyltransferase